MLCCAKCPSVNIPDQETDDQYSDTSTSIRFHIYHLIAVRLTINANEICHKCKQDSDSEQSKNVYTRKELVMMETTISNFQTSLYITEIQKLAFYITHVQILGKNNCGDSRRTSFKRQK